MLRKKIDNIEIVTLEDRLLSDSNLLKTDSIWYPIDSIYAKNFMCMLILY